MSTNYYRSPSNEILSDNRNRLIDRIFEINLTDSRELELQFKTIPDGYNNLITPWEEFTKDIQIHLGKRSAGWKFCWNFHDNKFYSNKEELLNFIREGIIIDEYGQKIDPEEFITMALDWGQPDGHIYNKEYLEYLRKDNQSYGTYLTDESSFDKIIDGLCVSSHTDFS